MEEKIRDYIQNAFVGVPEGKSSNDLQEEIIANLLEKYGDQLAMGKTENEAYLAVIASIGDLDKLVENLREKQEVSYGNVAEQKKSALLMAVAVGLYIMSPFLFMIGEALESEVIGTLFMFGAIAIATGLIVYRHMMRPAYLHGKRGNNTMVEEFQAWQKKSYDRQGFYRAMNSALWLVTLVVYFLISIQFGWSFSWLIFIAAAALQSAMSAIRIYQEGKDE